MEETFVNIAAHLPAMAERQPDTLAVALPAGRNDQDQPVYHQYTFAQLNGHSDRTAQALVAHGIRPGMRTVVMVPPCLEFFSLTFALFKIGAVPVLIDPGMGTKNLKICIAEAEPQAFIGVPKAHLARLLLGWGKSTLQHLVTVGRRFGWGGRSLNSLLKRASDQPYTMAPTYATDTAAILFTSGSTGVPKGAVYSHGNFMAQVTRLQEMYSIQPGEIDLPTFPLFALFAPALGMSSIVPEMDFTRPGSVDPQRIIEAIEQFDVTSMFGSPALIDRVGRYGVEHSVRFPTLRRVISAGAPVAPAVLERFSQLLSPGCQIYTPYGATEALPVCSIGSAEILGETRRLTEQGKGVCVGRPVNEIRLEIIQIDDFPIETWRDDLLVKPGEVGEIVVKGPQVTAAYFNRRESTELAKILDPDGGFFHRMGDLGYRDDQGRIWFCGRKSQRVVLPGTTLFTIPCEAIFNTHPAVRRSALVSVHDEEIGVRPVICIETEEQLSTGEQHRLTKELQALAQQYPHTRPIQTVLFHSGFPVDIRHNAKIFREKLAVWAKEELA